MDFYSVDEDEHGTILKDDQRQSTWLQEEMINKMRWDMFHLEGLGNTFLCAGVWLCGSRACLPVSCTCQIVHALLLVTPLRTCPQTVLCGSSGSPAGCKETVGISQFSPVLPQKGLISLQNFAQCSSWGPSGKPSTEQVPSRGYACLTSQGCVPTKICLAYVSGSSPGPHTCSSSHLPNQKPESGTELLQEATWNLGTELSSVKLVCVNETQAEPSTRHVHLGGPVEYVYAE
ncbi:uncharacterized protein LOC120584425 [Pteropus medius]|uniref:uncharacterized protein LOC120584425 n=1 Tax=Pteropus vampyrus TaxID=132908 RepID=UPI00196AA476|nr:uncharacterized protein LOC120584425 [Pteropus giganteus]